MTRNEIVKDEYRISIHRPFVVDEEGRVLIDIVFPGKLAAQALISIYCYVDCTNFALGVQEIQVLPTVPASSRDEVAQGTAGEVERKVDRQVRRKFERKIEPAIRDNLADLAAMIVHDRDLAAWNRVMRG